MVEFKLDKNASKKENFPKRKLWIKGRVVFLIFIEGIEITKVLGEKQDERVKLIVSKEFWKKNSSESGSFCFEI